ncbi:MAG: CotH kinase family protein, partial [Myxococcales bacterium]|nr:CotH kinase family protein [Myxococcales bacterium]
RKKGFFGSVSADRPSFRIAFDRFVAGQHFHTLERMALNNGRQDPSRLRTCLAYDVFRAAGLPAPRCAFAHVTVNGQDLGVYAHVESIDDPFLRQHFGDSAGYLYEGTLSDFRPEFQGTLEQKNHADTPDRALIEAVAAAALVEDAGLLEALDGALDLAQFIDLWAAEVLLGHWDGYAGNTNNFWIYGAQDGRARFVPWGPDATFAPTRLLFEGRAPPRSVLALGVLTWRLYRHPEGQRRYAAALRRLLDTAWDVDALVAKVDAWANLIGPHVMASNRQGHLQGVAQIRGFVREQPGAIRAELDAGPPVWAAGLRASLCRESAGTLDATFETTWGTWYTPNAFQTGSGTFDGAFGMVALSSNAAGAASGNTLDGRAALVMPAPLANGQQAQLIVRFPLADMVPGELPLWGNADCVVNLVDPRTQRATPLANCPEGSLVFEAAGTQPGAPVRGTFHAELFAPR